MSEMEYEELLDLHIWLHRKFAYVFTKALHKALSGSFLHAHSWKADISWEYNYRQEQMKNRQENQNLIPLTVLRQE